MRSRAGACRSKASRTFPPTTPTPRYRACTASAPGPPIFIFSSCLGHADAWPAGDLALQEAARLAFALPARPTAKEMHALAEPWRPWRAVAARMLWTYYRAVKGREGAPVAPTKPIASKPTATKSNQAKTGKRGQNGR